MELLVWEIYPKSLTSHSLPSKNLFYSKVLHNCQFITLLLREREEHEIFLALLASVPGLEERLINTSSECELSAIATLVRTI